MNEELKQRMPDAEELKRLIGDAAKLLGLGLIWDGVCSPYFQTEIGLVMFNPLDPERGDLMKVAEAAELSIHLIAGLVARHYTEEDYPQVKYEDFTKGDHQSLALAVLRAASAVWKARGE